MLPNFPLFPQQASTMAGQVDALYFFLIAVTAFFSILIAAGVIAFAVRFRRRHPDEVGHPIHGSLILELTWTLIPLAIAMVIFVWGASLYFKLSYPPSNATEVYVVGKRWMWKAQHVTGQREINELHVPIGQPIKLIIGSEDVIHSFYIPDFRVKMDAVPGRNTSLWFEATKIGEYHLFCAEYCGMSHSAMIGRIVVMSPADFQDWLSGGKPSGSMAEEGEKLFTQFACVTCHFPNGQGRGPSLVNLFGSKVTLTDGSTVTADENYIRESIMTPTAKIVAGYAPLMPTFQGQVSEEQLTQLIAYVKSLKSGGAGTPAPTNP
jgi:cytochrome c oxidase subunit II